MSSIGVELKLSGSAEFKKQMSEATSQVKLFNAQIKGLSDTMTSNGSAFSRHQKTTEALKGKLSALKAEAEALAKRIKEVTEASGEDSKAVTDLKTKMEYLQLSISSTEEALKAQGGTLGAVGAQMEAIGNKIQSVGGKISSVGDTLTTKLTAPLAAIGTISVKSFSDWESAFTGVMKTVDETATTTYADLEESIKKMATETASSKEEIAGVAEVAGQLGVKADDIETFTKTMVMLGDSTNLSAEEAATSLARMMTITGESMDSVSNVGSAIVALGNNFATSESEIVAMSTRLASAGTIAGMSTQDILALSTAMSSVGIQAEAGGTAMTQTLTGISQAVSEGGDKLEQLATVSGMTAEQFSSTWSSSPIEALQAFIGGLSQMNEAELDTYTVLDELDMSGIRQSNMLQSLALASNTLTDAVNVSNGAYEENVALTEEASKRYETFAAQMSQFKERVGNVAIEIGERLAPYIERLLAKVEEWIDKWDSLDSGTQDMIVKIGLIVAAIGPALSIVGRVTSSIGTIMTVGGSLLTHLGMFVGFITSTIVPLITGTIIPMIGTLATFITGTLLPALATIIVPLLPFIAIAAAVVAAGVLIYKNWDLIKQKAGELKDWLAEKFTAIGEGITQKWTEITEGLTMALETIKTTVTGALDGLKAKIEENGGGIQGIFATHMELYNQIWSDAFNMINEATGGKLGEVVNTISGKLAEIGNFFTELKDSALAWGQDLIQNFINGVLAKWEELKTTVSNVAQSVKDFLGFSEPKKGPLSNFHTYGPDMMKLYAEGIENSKYLVQNAVADVARDVSMLGNPGLDSDSIYSAVRQGSEDANISLSIGDREFQRYLRNIGVVFNA